MFQIVEDLRGTSETASQPIASSTYETRIESGALVSHVEWPESEFRDQSNERIDLHRDLIRDHSIVLNFFYTRCDGKCPVTMGRMSGLARLVADSKRTDVRFVSISLDCENDTPECLAEYAERVLPKGVDWRLLNGSQTIVNTMRRYLGFYELDENTDRIPRSHASMVLIGNDLTHRWISLPAVSSLRQWRSVLARVST